MKKLICLALFMLLLCSCSPEKQTDPTGDPVIPAQPSAECEYGFTLVNKPESIMESSPLDADLGMINASMYHAAAAQADGYLYYSVIGENNNMIYRCDMALSETSPLCKKENCDHDSEECPFFSKTGVDMLNCYDGKLWWISGQKLYSCKFDGSDASFVRELGDEVIFDAMIHRGYMYFRAQSDTNEGITTTSSSYWLKRVSLKDTSAPAETVIHKVANTDEHWGGSFVPCKDMIYIVLHEYTGKCSEDHLYRFDAKSGEAELIYSGKVGTNIGVSPSGELFYEINNGIYRFNEATRSVELVFDVPEDDINLYYGNVHFANDAIILSDDVSYSKNMCISYSIYGYDGVLISKGAFKDIDGFTIPETEQCYARCLGTTSDRLLFIMSFSSSNTYTKGQRNERYTFIAAFPKFSETTPDIIYSHHYIYTGDTTIKPE